MFIHNFSCTNVVLIRKTTLQLFLSHIHFINRSYWRDISVKQFWLVFSHYLDVSGPVLVMYPYKFNILSYWRANKTMKNVTSSRTICRQTSLYFQYVCCSLTDCFRLRLHTRYNNIGCVCLWRVNKQIPNIYNSKASLFTIICIV